jgi:hypothetical protein
MTLSSTLVLVVVVGIPRFSMSAHFADAVAWFPSWETKKDYKKNNCQDDSQGHSTFASGIS